jgi:hypothetical protein
MSSGLSILKNEACKPSFGGITAIAIWLSILEKVRIKYKCASLGENGGVAKITVAYVEVREGGAGLFFTSLSITANVDIDIDKIQHRVDISTQRGRIIFRFFLPHTSVSNKLF